MLQTDMMLDSLLGEGGMLTHLFNNKPVAVPFFCRDERAEWRARVCCRSRQPHTGSLGTRPCLDGAWGGPRAGLGVDVSGTGVRMRAAARGEVWWCVWFWDPRV